MLGRECRARSPELVSAPPECSTPVGKLPDCSLQHFSLQGNQLEGSRRGTGSGQQPRHGGKHKQQPHGSSMQSSASDMPPLPVPTSTAMQDRECLYPPIATSQHEKHKSNRREFILTLVPSGHGCGWAHPQDSCSSCSLLLPHGNNLCQNVWFVSSLPGVCLRLTPGSKDRWTFKGTKRAEWL